MAHSLPSLLTNSSNGDVLSEMSGFCRRVNEASDLLRPYAALFGSLLTTFRDSLSVPYSRFKQSKFLLGLHKRLCLFPNFKINTHELNFMSPRHSTVSPKL